MKVQYTERVDVLHAPEAAKPFLGELGAKESSRDGVRYEIPVANNVRNRDGYRTAFARDIASLRSKGVIFEVVPNGEGALLIAKGEIDSKTHQKVKPNGKTPPPQSNKSKSA
jgi:hypothetical protein